MSGNEVDRVRRKRGRQNEFARRVTAARVLLLSGDWYAEAPCAAETGRPFSGSIDKRDFGDSSNMRSANRPTTAIQKKKGDAGKEAGAGPRLCFSAPLHRPSATGKPPTWTFLTLPTQASAKLPSRGQVTVEGTLNGRPFQATLEPDGQGGHWLKVDRKLREAAAASPGDVVELEIAPVSVEPEPKVPPDLRKALAAAPPKAREAWSDITPAARRDFVFWIVSAKQAETRDRRIATACDMLAKGKRRPCCFDRSGMYARSLSCPVPEDPSNSRRRDAGQ